EQAHPELHDILRFRAAMMVRQSGAKEEAEQGPSEHAREHYAPGCYGTHWSPPPRLLSRCASLRTPCHSSPQMSGDDAGAEQRQGDSSATPPAVLAAWRIRRPSIGQGFLHAGGRPSFI